MRYGVYKSQRNLYGLRIGILQECDRCVHLIFHMTDKRMQRWCLLSALMPFIMVTIHAFTQVPKAL